MLRKFSIGILILVALCVGAYFVLSVVLEIGTHQSEKARTARFIRDKDKLEQIVKMSNEDFNQTRVTRIAFDFTRLDNDASWPRAREKWGITEERWQEYRHLFKTADTPVGLNRDGNHIEQIFFPTWGTGMSGEGLEEGFVWSPSPPTAIHTSRTDFQVIPLGGYWYLYKWSN